MPSFLRPRQVARAKRCRSSTVYTAIRSGSLQAATITTATGRRRFVITEAAAKRWSPTKAEG